jgi:hypothetical protein
VVRIAKIDSTLTVERRNRFADMLKKSKITRREQITSAVQAESLFSQLVDLGDRCAFRIFLGLEFPKLVTEDRILTEDQLAEAAVESEGVFA